jgi:hypothetical protein
MAGLNRLHRPPPFTPHRRWTKQPPSRWGTGRQAARAGTRQALPTWQTLMGSANMPQSHRQSKSFTDRRGGAARFTARRGSAPMERGPPASAALLRPATPDAQRWAAFQSGAFWKGGTYDTLLPFCSQLCTDCDRGTRRLDWSNNCRAVLLRLQPAAGGAIPSLVPAPPIDTS